MKRIRAHAAIKGHVQGVFFRADTKSTAMGLKLTGWVRNRSDGSVEAVFEGPEESVRKAIEWCGHGPLGANVLSVDVRYEECAEEFDGFSTLATL